MKPGSTTFPSRPGLLPNLLIWSFGLLVTLTSVADDGLPQPNWERSLAVTAAHQDTAAATVAEWMAMVVSHREIELLELLESSPDRGSPEYEYRLRQLAIGLADSTPDNPSADLLQWLVAYPEQVLVAHEDHPDYGVPLFSVEAAARGAISQQKRQQARLQSLEILQSDPFAWPQQYLGLDSVAREGFEQSLTEILPADLDVLAGILEDRLPSEPALSRPFATVAAVLSDSGLMFLAFQQADSRDVASLLRQAADLLDASARAQLLALAVESGSTERAALSVSVLAPGLRSDTQVSDTLLKLLGDAELGAAAALALAGHPDAHVQMRLQALADGDTPAAYRAALALDRLTPESSE